MTVNHTHSKHSIASGGTVPISLGSVSSLRGHVQPPVPMAQSNEEVMRGSLFDLLVSPKPQAMFDGADSNCLSHITTHSTDTTAPHCRFHTG